MTLLKLSDMSKWAAIIDQLIADNSNVVLQDVLIKVYNRQEWEDPIAQKKTIALDMGLSTSTLSGYMSVRSELPQQHLPAFMKATDSLAPVYFLIRQAGFDIREAGQLLIQIANQSEESSVC